ncbi:hypothetical protein WME75_21775 [Sorangium sp. So ce1014]|uniref:hypothetical protein n=1 Tax=Sorangium sp. So ce1014 TaxID=3133326 RepID=UPI003F64737C
MGLVNAGPEFSRLEALKQAKALILDIDSIEKVEQPVTPKGPDASALTASILDKLGWQGATRPGSRSLPGAG